jgi:hypothetical protein
MTTPSALPGTPGPYTPGPPRPYMPGSTGPYVHPPYGQPPQPPKKRRTWLIVLLVVLAVMLVGIVGCAALVSTAGKAIDEVSTEASQSQQAEVDRNAPREVTPGKAFTVGKHQTLAGWKVEQENFGDGFNVTGKVKNVSDETSTAFIHFKFIDKSGEVLGNVDCNSGDLEPGQTQALNCIPNGNFGNYTKATAEATF